MKKGEEVIVTGQERSKAEFGEFKKFFSEGVMAEIRETEVPAAAMNIFELKSEQFVSERNYRPRNFEHYFVVEHANGDKTYLAQQTKTYDTNKHTERLTYFVDMRGSEFLGYSEMRNNILQSTPYFKDKPFVGYTRTEKQFQRQGLGVRRLKLMNAFSEIYYHLPLYSDTMNEEASIWEGLVLGGFARRFKEDENMRYVFLAQKE